MRNRTYAVILAILVAIFVAAVNLLPLGRSILQSLTDTFSGALNIILALTLLFGLTVVASLIRYGINRVDDRDKPDEELGKMKHFGITLVGMLLFYVLQIALAQYLIVHTGLRPGAENLGMVRPVIETANMWWGLWGVGSFITGYFGRDVLRSLFGLL